VGPYECKISILALAKLLEHAIATEDKRFQNIFVRGDRIINPIEGIKTRSKSKGEKELYTQVPLLVKIYKILINEIHGLLEEKKDEFDTEYDDGDECGDDNLDGDDDNESEGNSDKNDIEVDENGADSLNSYLNKYDLFEDAFDKDEYEIEDDPEALDNPLMKIDLLEFLTNYLKTLSQHPCYKLFDAHHNDLEREVLKEIGIAV
jgi:importin-9